MRLPGVGPITATALEGFLLHGRNIRADVHKWVSARLPKNSRLL